MGWGIGIVFHAISTFGLPGLGKDWEDRLMERELERIEREQEISEWRNDYDQRNSPSSETYLSEEPPLKLRKLGKQARGDDFV